jgi:hypothetical protein
MSCNTHTHTQTHTQTHTHTHTVRTRELGTVEIGTRHAEFFVAPPALTHLLQSHAPHHLSLKRVYCVKTDNPYLIEKNKSALNG